MCKDDVRDVAFRYDQKANEAIHKAHPNSSIRIDTNDMCYEVCFGIGLTQLRVGMPGVVFESPLGRVALGERAVAIFKEVQAFVILIDCFAERSVWEERLAKRTPHTHRPRNADQILAHYNGCIDFELSACDASISVDCARPTHESIEKVRSVIAQLVVDEGGELSTIMKSPSLR